MITKSILIVEETRTRHVCPAGTHNAVCAGVYDAGVQKSANGWPEKRKFVTIFEVEEKISAGPLAGQPYRVSRIVSASLNDKSTLTALLTSWLGKDPRKRVNGKTEFELSTLIGKPCMLTVAHKTTPDGDSQAVITAISAHMKGLPTLTSTLDPTETHDWVRRMQDQRLDKAQQLDGYQPIPEAPIMTAQPAVENPPPAAEEDAGDSMLS